MNNACAGQDKPDLFHVEYYLHLSLSRYVLVTVVQEFDYERCWLLSSSVVTKGPFLFVFEDRCKPSRLWYYALHIFFFPHGEFRSDSHSLKRRDHLSFLSERITTAFQWCGECAAMWWNTAFFDGVHTFMFLQGSTINWLFWVCLLVLALSCGGCAVMYSLPQSTCTNLLKINFVLKSALNIALVSLCVCMWDDVIYVHKSNDNSCWFLIWTWRDQCTVPLLCEGAKLSKPRRKTLTQEKKNRPLPHPNASPLSPNLFQSFLIPQ